MSDRSSPAGLGRDVAAVVGGLALIGLVCGVLWWLLVSPAEFTRLRNGGEMSEAQLARRFTSDATYVVVAAVAGLLAGLVLTWWRSRDPLVTSGLLVLGSLVAAAVMALSGHLLGPGDTRAALAAAKVGTHVPERLVVDALSVYLVWPAAVLVGALLVLLGRPPETDR
jgi:hypothetical protein